MRARCSRRCRRTSTSGCGTASAASRCRSSTPSRCSRTLPEPGQVRLRQQHDAGLRRGQDPGRHRRPGHRRLVAVLQCHARRALQRLTTGADVNTWQFADSVHPTTGGHKVHRRRIRGAAPGLRLDLTEHERVPMHPMTLPGVAAATALAFLRLARSPNPKEPTSSSWASPNTRRTRRRTASPASASRPAPTSVSATRRR
jgi:hypothetical protein